jgi:hypothetical protein
MSQSPPQELTDVFNQWLDAQRNALEQMMAAKHPGSPTDWAEGYRWVTRLSSLALEWFVEKGDPLYPTLFRSQDEFKKLIVDNPDVNYYFSPLDETQTYRLWGNRGEARYLGITIGTDILRGGAKRMGTLGQHYIDQFKLQPNGDFEIMLSREPREGNWIKLEPGAGQMSIRETFHDRRKQRAAVLHLERISGDKKAPQLTPEELARKLQYASMFVMFVAKTCINMFEQSEANLNRLQGASGAHHVKAQEDNIRSHSDTDMVYMGGRWRIEPDQALVITIKPPPYDFLYWGLVIVNPWMESYDYRYARTCTNNELAEKNADGSWAVVIAPSDPGVPNWLDTGGRLEGFMLLRWVLAGDSPPTPTCEVMSLEKSRAKR